MAVTLRGSGQVPVQIVQATYSTQVTTTSTSFVTTGLSASITPTNSLNRILVLTNGVFYANANNRGIRLQLTRGSTDIYNSPTYSLYAGSSNIVSNLSVNYLDSPSTTSSTTYTVNFATPEGATVTAQYNSAPSILILMELAYA